MNRIKISILAISLLILLGCSGKQADQSPAPEAQPAAAQMAEAPSPDALQQESAAPAQTPKPAAQSQKAPAAKPTPSGGQTQTTATASSPAAAQNQIAASSPKPVEPVAPPQPKVVTIPGGTVLGIRLQAALDSGVNATGEAFQAMLDEDLVMDGRIVALRGSTVAGKIVNAASAGRVEGRAAMSLTLTDLQIGGASYPIRTNTLAFEAESTTKKDATKVGLGAGIGAVIGAIAGGGKGAAIGAAVGGGAGTATVLATKGKELNFPAEHQFSFTLSQDLQVQLR